MMSPTARDEYDRTVEAAKRKGLEIRWPTREEEDAEYEVFRESGAPRNGGWAAERLLAEIG
jgi:hypothetical protein